MQEEGSWPISQQDVDLMVPSVTKAQVFPGLATTHLYLPGSLGDYDLEPVLNTH